LHRVPSDIGKPFLKWIWNISPCRALQQEHHFLICVFNIDDLLLHKTEGQLGTDNWLVCLKETSCNPLENSHPDHCSESNDSWFFVLELLSLFNGFEEEGGE